MLGTFLYAFNAISPILLLVLGGYYLKIKGIFTQDFFKKVNYFAFHYCFPPLMFTNLYTLSSIREIDGKLALYLMGSIVFITIVGVILANILTKVRNRKGVLIQAGFRSNFAVIGLPLAEGMTGASGRVVAASMQAPIVIYFNFMSVLALAVYSEDAKFDVKKIAKNVISNPMIQGLGIGFLALVIREFIPLDANGELVFSIQGKLPWFYTTLNYLGRMGTPLCLIALGGQFNFSDAPSIKKELVAGVLMRLVLAPVIGFGIGYVISKMGLIRFDPTSISIMIAAFGSPIATSSAVMAAEMKGDDVLANQIVVWSCVFSMLTVFLMIVGFRSVGLL
ncbi:MAG: AEC family transporter [Lachnospiraceae bacterium]|nr:AEC family transporter [Lachnospiraceae bacterium]